VNGQDYASLYVDNKKLQIEGKIVEYQFVEMDDQLPD